MIVATIEVAPSTGKTLDFVAYERTSAIRPAYGYEARLSNLPAFIDTKLLDFPDVGPFVVSFGHFL